MSSTIVKIQRELTMGLPSRTALIYNKYKSVYCIVAFESVAHLFNDGDERVYCTAKPKRNGGVKKLKRIEDQNW